MGLPGITFAPIVNLVDAGHLSQEAGELQNFMWWRCCEPGLRVSV